MLQDPTAIAILCSIGLIAGVLGGMLGIGGSLVMIPALVWVFGTGVEHPGFNQHLYQASAMIVNLCVAIPATWRHHQHNAIEPRALRGMIPAAIVAILLGVWVSNLPIFRATPTDNSGPILLGRLLAAFMLYVVVQNIRKLRKPKCDPSNSAESPTDQEEDGDPIITLPRSAATGAATGLIAGLLGLGGGGIAVPMQQVLMRQALRRCIANSAALICITAGFGAIYKNMTLAQHGLEIHDSLLLAAALSPTAIIGGYIGGKLTHTVPLRGLRLAFIFLMLAAAYKLAHL
jgi:uncharacterized membrane protein YfcA